MSHPFGILHVMDQDLKGSTARVTDLARRQHGLITGGQAVACGITKRSIEHRVRMGSWSGILRGVYVIGGAPDTFEQRLLAQLLQVGPDAVASHVAAARIWGLPGSGERIEWPGHVAAASDVRPDAATVRSGCLSGIARGTGRSP